MTVLEKLERSDLSYKMPIRVAFGHFRTEHDSRIGLYAVSGSMGCLLNSGFRVAGGYFH